MSERHCPQCAQPVAAHQTLCPSCRVPVPSTAGPVGTSSSSIAIGAPPPRRAAALAPPATDPAVADPAAAVAPPAAAPPVAPAAAPYAQVAPTPAASGYGGGIDPTAVGTGPAWSTAAAAAAAPAPLPVPPAAGTIGVPGAAVLDERGNLPGGLLGLIAAALVVVGVFLPWMSVESHDVSGWRASGDARVLLGLAGAVTVAAALLVGGARSLVLRLFLVLAGLVAIGFGVFEITSVNGVDEFDTSIGLGLFLVLGGGAAALLAGVLTRHKRFR